MMRSTAASYADLLACPYSRGTAIVVYHFQVMTKQTTCLDRLTRLTVSPSEPYASQIGFLGTWSRVDLGGGTSVRYSGAIGPSPTVTTEPE